MKKLSDYSLKWKLLLVPIISTASFAAYLFYSSLVLSTGNSLLTEFRDTDYPILEMSEKNLNNNDRLVDALNAAAATGEVDFLQVAKDKASEILSLYGKLGQLDKEHGEEIEKLKSEFDTYFTLALDVAFRMATHKNVPSAKLINEFRISRDTYVSGAVAYKKLTEKDFHDDIGNAIESSKRAQAWGVAIGTFMLFFIVALTYLVTRGILALEKGVAERNKMLAAINRELEHEIQKLKIAEEAKIHAEATSLIKDQFLANMSHEIRTPMNAIIGLTQLTLDSELSPKQRNHLGMVHTSSLSLLRILDDILDFSKIESGKLSLEQVEFSLEEVVKSVSDLFSAKIADRGLELFLEINCEADLNLVGDPLRLGQILNNLISNAIKFTEKGEIHLKVETLALENEKLKLQFSIRDTGIGMNNIQSHRLFEAFGQADSSTTRKYGGTGLGLSISKQLVVMMGGEISLTSVLGKGSTFTFTANFGKGNSNLNPYHQHGIHGVRVLIVDDQETSLIVLEHYLEIWKFDVTGATSGEEALKLIALAEQEGRPYEILMLDWSMPGMDGLELTRRMESATKQGTLKHAPTIVMVTSYDREVLLNEPGAESLDSVLVKPVTPSALFESLLRIQQPQLAIQNSSISAQKAKIKDRRIDLFELAAPIRGARILLVEDNDINQEVAREFLTKAGFITTVANHGAEAVEWVKKEIFDAVLMDLQMPVMDGYKAAELIRMLPQGKQLPIIALSAAAMVHDRQASESAGMNDHISKPLNPAQLVNILLKWVKHRQVLDQIYNADNATVNQTNILPAELPGIDLETAIFRLGGNQEMLVKLLQRFASDYCLVDGQIEEFLIDKQFDQATALLHRVRGAAATLGATILAESAQNLENEINASQTSESLIVFVHNLNDVVITINKYLVPFKLVEKQNQALPDIVKIEIGLNKLSVALSNHRVIAYDELAELVGNIRNYVSANLLSELERNLLNFDFDSGNATLKLIIAEWNANQIG